MNLDWDVLMRAVGEWIGPMHPTPVLRLCIAALLGAGVGWERERHGRPAGLRTHLLLCLGCALVMLMSLYVPSLFFQYEPGANVRVDASRIAAQVVSGLGFLGAGAIIVLGQRIRGLTTAACIWVTAAIGLAVGAGYLMPAIFAWGVTLFALMVVGTWERRMERKDQYIGLTMQFAQSGRRIEDLRELLDEHGMQLLEYTVDREEEKATYRLALRYETEPDFEALTDELCSQMEDEDIRSVKWGVAASRG
ncbi:MAG: MgtC/SapB family protein [Planctomycetota bacterium]